MQSSTHLGYAEGRPSRSCSQLGRSSLLRPAGRSAPLYSAQPAWPLLSPAGRRRGELPFVCPPTHGPCGVVRLPARFVLHPLALIAKGGERARWHVMCTSATDCPSRRRRRPTHCLPRQRRGPVLGKEPVVHVLAPLLANNVGPKLGRKLAGKIFSVGKNCARL